MRFGRWLGAMTVVVGLSAVPGLAAAQEELPAPPQEEAIEVTEDLLERFVAVYPSVVEVAQTAQAQLGTADTDEEAQEIQQAAQEQVAELLEQGGLTVPEYEAVVARLNEDAELRAEVEQRLAERQGAGPS